MEQVPKLVYVIEMPDDTLQDPEVWVRPEAARQRFEELYRKFGDPEAGLEDHWEPEAEMSFEDEAGQVWLLKGVPLR